VIKATLVGAAVLAGFIMGCYNPVLEPLPTYTPYPSPEARIVIVTPTPVPDEEWTCFTGKIEVVDGTAWEDNISIAIIGEQVICAKEWKISNLYGPVGSLESSPEKPLTFRDLQELIDTFVDPEELDVTGPQVSK
jgi:hypothetical protein